MLQEDQAVVVVLTFRVVEEAVVDLLILVAEEEAQKILAEGVAL